MKLPTMNDVDFGIFGDAVLGTGMLQFIITL